MARTKSKKVAALAAAPVVEKEVKFLTPEEYTFGVNSRDVASDPQYADHVAAVAFSIHTQGQLQPAEGFRTEAGDVVVYAGHTRGQAVKLLRQGFEYDDPASGDKVTVHNPDAKLWVAIDPTAKSPEDAYVNSLTENVKRKNLNPIQEAIAHETLRSEPFNWSDTRISNFFGYNNTNRVALLKAVRENLGDKYQDKIAAGQLAPYAAKDLIAVPAEERDAILAKAKIGTEDDGNVRYDGAVIRDYLRAAAEATGGGESGGEGGGTSDKTPAAPKRTLKEVKRLAEEVKADNGDPDVAALLGSLVKWFEVKIGDTALLNALDRFRGRETAKGKK
jgi:ParB-like chromosome segregation protein Spo0J